MRSILDVRVQKLFLVILCLKVLSSGIGWYFIFPWSFGFLIPLALMSIYIIIGLKRHDSDVSDEKFADTCYYLGFIFTITSIIFSLFDLPNIGDRIQDIAVRFGAAMVCTVLGLSVRVYLVSFKKDIVDAIHDAEDAVLDASRRLTEQLTMALEKLHGFETQVDAATNSSVERVNLQIESLSKNHADKLTSFFTDLTDRNQAAFTAALTEVKGASERLAMAVNGYSQGMRINLAGIEAKVGVFSDAVTARIKNTTFPDDFFIKQLEAPMAQMKDAASTLSGEVKLVSAEVKSSSKTLTTALKKLQEQSGNAGDSLDVILKLTEQQQAVLSSAQGQLISLEQLTSTLKGFEITLLSTTAGLKASNDVNNELSNNVAAVLKESVRDRQQLDNSIASIVDKLDGYASATLKVASTLDSSSKTAANNVNAIIQRLDAGVTESKAVAAMLTTSANATYKVAVKLDGVVTAEAQTTASLNILGQRADTAINKVDQAALQFQRMLQQFSKLDDSLRAQGYEFGQVVQRLMNVRDGTYVPAQITDLPTTQESTALESAISRVRTIEPVVFATSDDAVVPMLAKDSVQ
jgi:uncharacterized protein YaaQ